MDLAQALSELGLTESAEIVEPGWEASQQSLPVGEIEFLAPQFVHAACAEFGVAGDGVEAALAMAKRIEEWPALRAFAWHYHRVLYGGPRPAWRQVHDWPSPSSALGPEAGLFCTVVFLSGLPRMHAEHRARRVPEAVMRDTLSDIELGLEVGRQGQRRGMRPNDVQWFAEFLRAELFRLGRLQFQPGPFDYALRAFRHRESNAVLALSESGVRYRPDGQLARKGDAEGLWTATLETSEDGAVGYPVLPTGRAVQEQVTLPAAAWLEVLTPTAPALHIHIPGSGPGGERMDYDQCGGSLRAAMEFFPRHYPEHRFRAFACGSWVLDTWLETALPPTSNMRRLQEEVYLFPSWVSPHDLIENVFDRLPDDLRQAPRETTLQRAILEVLEAGREPVVGGGGCFLLPDDLRWGGQVYRNQRLPAELGWIRDGRKESHGSRAGAV